MIPYRLRGNSTRGTILRIVQLPLRAGLAAALSQAIATFLGLPYPAFAMVAAILVTDLAPEQSRQLGLRRIGGTLIGAALWGGAGRDPGAASLVDRALDRRRDVRVQSSAGGGRGEAGGVHQRGRASVSR